MVHERRKFERSDIFHVIEIKSYTTLLGLIRNFSYQGFSFEMDNIDLEQKENIEFTLKQPQSNSSVSFLGDVVWEKWVAHTFLAGIKLKPMDKKIKDKLIELLYTMRDTPIALLNFDKKSEISISETKEEKSVSITREKITSGASTNSKRKLISNFVIGLSISFLILLGFIIFKAMRIPVINTNYQATPKELDPKEHLFQSENILIKPVKVPVGSRVLDENAFSHKPNEAQHVDTKSIIQISSDTIETEKTLNKKLKADDQHVSRLIYTIQIKTLLKIADAQKNFNFMLQLLNKKNLDLLRIEKIGKYYTVRLGTFEHYGNAEKFLQAIRPRLSEAIILKANIKNERIVRLYE